MSRQYNLPCVYGGRSAKQMHIANHPIEQILLNIQLVEQNMIAQISH